MLQVKTSMEFQKEINEYNPNIRIISKYISYHKIIKAKCVRCNYEWDTTPLNLKNKQGKCPNCELFKIAKERKDKEVALEQKYPYLKVLGEYINSTEKILFHCSKCNTDFERGYQHIFKTGNCPNCVKKNISISYENFVEEMKKINPNLIVLKEYFKGTSKPIHLTCKFCNREIVKKNAYALRRGESCGCKEDRAFKSKVRKGEIKL